MAITGRTICTDAMLELGIIQATETPSSEDLNFVLRKLNRLINRWNGKREAVYAEDSAIYTLIPNLQPATIGPTGATYTVAQRPVTIDFANIILNNVTPVVRNPLKIRDWQWWASNSVQAVTAELPTDLYYQTGWPNGSLFLWCVPTTAWQLELFTRTLLSEYTLDTNFSMPPGYQDAITLTLAEQIASPFTVVPSAETVVSARKARQEIFENNVVTPLLTTFDAGMPSNNGHQATFNYRTGLDFPSSARSS